ncbi:MAG: transglutaminase-like domain-containing protein, partial [Ruminococcus sp.]|nr:transglutaminase-like domain-containing protein [Ruminococcus sp.]
KVTGLSSGTKYTFKVRAYRKDTAGKVVYGKCGVKKKTTVDTSILAGASKSSSNKNKVSAADQKILKKFADEHFEDDWSDYDKIQYTFDWIVSNYTYATGSNWTKISGLSYVDAIFNYKLGQCAQYNGAMVAMINYIGYNATLVHVPGHYRGEIEIDGVVYVIDAGGATSSPFMPKSA